MTQGASKEAIIHAQDDGQSGKVHFHFFGEPFRYHPNRLLARLQSWLLYRDWQIKSLPRALELQRKATRTDTTKDATLNQRPISLP